MAIKYSALVPVKALVQAKSRLSTYLSPRQRESLVLDMLHHVIHTLCDSEVFEQVYVVSADPRVLELVQHWDAEPLREMQPGHNAALQAAAFTVMERAAWRQGAYATWLTLREQDMFHQEQAENSMHMLPDEGLLTISADLPLITPRDVQELVRAAENYQVVLAGSSDSTGTNALLTRPPLVLPYLFGVNSLPTYIQATHARQLSYTLFQHDHLAFDVDTPEDLHTLEQTSHGWSSMASLAR
jgi:2-phospho-L-lactate/phosphoenolpyruvate guanylyltransferase